MLFPCLACILLLQQVNSALPFKDLYSTSQPALLREKSLLSSPGADERGTCTSVPGDQLENPVQENATSRQVSPRDNHKENIQERRAKLWTRGSQLCCASEAPPRRLVKAQINGLTPRVSHPVGVRLADNLH